MQTPALYVWRSHDTETFSVLLVLCEGNPMDSYHKGLTMWSFDVFVAVSPSKALKIHSSWQWFETSCWTNLWRHSDVFSGPRGPAGQKGEVGPPGAPGFGGGTGVISKYPSSMSWDCLINVSRALQNILSKFMYSRNCTSYENFKLKLCTCAQSIALGTRTKFQLEVLNTNVISSIV